MFRDSFSIIFLRRSESTSSRNKFLSMKKRSRPSSCWTTFLSSLSKILELCESSHCHLSSVWLSTSSIDYRSSYNLPSFKARLSLKYEMSCTFTSTSRYSLFLNSSGSKTSACLCVFKSVSSSCYSPNFVIKSLSNSFFSFNPVSS